MADTRGIRAGRAYVELGVADKLTKGLEKAQARLKAFGEGLQRIGKGLATLGGSVLAPIMLGVKAFTEGEGHRSVLHAARLVTHHPQGAALGHLVVDVGLLEAHDRMRHLVGAVAEGHQAVTPPVLLVQGRDHPFGFLHRLDPHAHPPSG